MKLKTTALFLLAALFSTAARAEGLDSGDTAWILASTALVLFMTLPGLALFYGGLVQPRNVLSVLMQCFAITCVVSILWVLVGYSLVFSDGGAVNAWIGGLDKAFMQGVTRDALSGSIPETVFSAFQMTFAIITPALVIGGFAERMRFPSMLLFSLLWFLVVYVPVAHWVWGGGWLADRGTLDFAGGIVVHITAGVGALVAALVLGPRKGFLTRQMMPHNLTMTITGAGMLWVGWFGFNAGSALAANGDAGMALMVTHISAATGAFTWMMIEWIKYGKASALGVATGMVAGLGTITPASGFVGPMAALFIGLAAGIVCFYATNTLKNVLRVDDSLDVFPVHGVGGIIGTLFAGFFIASEWGGAGLAEGMSTGSQMMAQLTGVLSVFAWTAIATFVLLRLVGVLTPLRASDEEETEGLDISQHEERGYNF
jgi:Amt family ammonium transporter